MAMDALLPSEIARMVYGYLLEERCTEAATLFLRESSNLEECRQVLSVGRHFSTRVCGLTLLDVLEKFCLLNTIVQEKLENFDKLDKLRHCSDLTSQIKVLFEEYKGRNFISTVNTATQSTPSLHGSPSKFRKRRIFANKEDDKTKRHAQEIIEESQDNNILDQSPSTSIEATPLKNLPGYTGEVEAEKYKKLNPKTPEQNSFKSTPQKNTVNQNAYLQKVQKGHQNSQLQEIQKDEILVKQKCPNFNKDVNFQTENLIKLIDSEVQTEFNNVSVSDKNIMTETEQKTYIDIEVQTSNVGSPESDVQAAETLGESSEKPLNRTEAIEKIVENTNSELKPIKSNDDAKEAYSKSFLAEFNKAIEAAANKGENDPEIVDLINVIVPPQQNVHENAIKATPDQCEASYSTSPEQRNSISEETVSESSIEKDVVVTNNNVNKHKILESKNSDKSRNTNLKNSANMEINNRNQIFHQVDPKTLKIITNSTEIKQVDSINSQIIVSKENNMRHNTETLFNDLNSLHLQKRCTNNSDHMFSHNNTITSTPIKTYTAMENFDTCDWFSTQDLPMSNTAYYKDEVNKYVATTASGIYTSTEAVVTYSHFLSPIASTDTNKIIEKINCTLANTVKDQTLHTPDVFFPPKISTAVSVNSDLCPMNIMSSTQKNKTPTLQKSSEIIDQLFDIQSSQKSDKNLDNLSSDLKDNNSNDCNKYFNVDSVMLFGADSNISSIPMPMYVQEIEIEDSITLTGTGLSPFLKVIKKSDNTETDNIKQNEKVTDNETSNVLSVASSNNRIENNILESKITENTKCTPTKVVENRPKASRKSLSTPKKPNSYIRALNFDTPINRSQSESKVNNTDSCLSPDSLKRSLKNSCKSSLFQSPPFENSEFDEQKTNTKTFSTIPELVELTAESKPLKKDSSLQKKEFTVKPFTEHKSWDSELRKNLGRSEDVNSVNSSSKKRSRSESSRKSYKKAKKDDKNTPKNEKKSYKKSSKKSKKDEKLNSDNKKKEDIKVEKREDVKVEKKKEDMKDMKEDIKTEKKKDEVTADKKKEGLKVDKKKEDVQDSKRNADIKTEKKKEEVTADKKKQDIKADRKKEEIKIDKRKEDIQVERKKEEVKIDKRKEDIQADRKKEEIKINKRKEDIQVDRKKEEVKIDKRKEDIQVDRKKEEVKIDKRKEDIQVDRKKEEVNSDKRKEDIQTDRKKKEVKIDKRKEDIKVDKKKEEVRADKKKEGIKLDKRKEEIKADKKKDDFKVDKWNEKIKSDKKKEDIKLDKKEEGLKVDKKKEDNIADKKKEVIRTDKKKEECKNDKKKDDIKSIKKEDIKANKKKEEIETEKKKEQNKNEKDSSKIKIINNSAIPLNIESFRKEKDKEKTEGNCESKSRVSKKQDEVKETKEKIKSDLRSRAHENIVQVSDVIEEIIFGNEAEHFHANNNKKLENLEEIGIEVESSNINKINSEHLYSINKEKIEPAETKLNNENTNINNSGKTKDPLIALLSDSINDDNDDIQNTEQLVFNKMPNLAKFNSETMNGLRTGSNNAVNIQDDEMQSISNQLTSPILSTDVAAAVYDHTKEAAETPLEDKNSVDELEEQLNILTNAESPPENKNIIYVEVRTVERGKVVQKKYARLKTLDTKLALSRMPFDDFAHDYEVPGKDDDSLQVPPTPRVLSPSSSSLILPLSKMSEDSRTISSLIATPLECPKTPNIIITPKKGQNEDTFDVPQKTVTCYEPTINNSDSSKKPEITQFEVIKENLKPIVETCPKIEENNLSKIQAPMSYREKQDEITSENYDNSTSSVTSCSCASCWNSTTTSESEENEEVEEVEGEANPDDEDDDSDEEEEQEGEDDEDEKDEGKEEAKKEVEKYERYIIKQDQKVRMTAETSPAKVFSINKTDEELADTIQETPAKDSSCPEVDIFETPNISKPVEQPTNLNTKISQMMILKNQENQILHARPKPKIISVKRVLPKVVTKPPIKFIKALPKNIQLQAEEIKNELVTLPPINQRLMIDKSEEEVALAIKSIENHKFNKSLDEAILLSATPSPANKSIDKNISNKSELAQAIESLTRTETETIEKFGTDEDCNSDANFKLVLEDDCEKEENSNDTGRKGNAQEDDSLLNNSHSHNTRFQSEQRRKEKERRKLGNCTQPCQEIVIIFNEETYKKKRRKGFSDKDLCPIVADEEHMCILRPTQLETLLDIRPKRKKPVRRAQGKKEKCLKLDESSHDSMLPQIYSNDSESIPDGVAHVAHDEATNKYKRSLDERESLNKQVVKKRKKNVFVY